MTARAGQLGQDSWEKTVRTEQLDRTTRTGWSEHDSKDRTGRKESLDRTARTGHACQERGGEEYSGQDTHDRREGERMVRTGQPGQESEDRKARI
jgi:hypothetical protein